MVRHGSPSLVRLVAMPPQHYDLVQEQSLQLPELQCNARRFGLVSEITSVCPWQAHQIIIQG